MQNFRQAESRFQAERGLYALKALSPRGISFYAHATGLADGKYQKLPNQVASCSAADQRGRSNPVGIEAGEMLHRPTLESVFSTIRWESIYQTRNLSTFKDNR